MTKLFQNGGSKAVRIPAELCPSGPEVFIWREPESKNLIISETSPSDFDAFFAIQKELLPLLTPDELASEVRFQPPMEVPKFMNAEAK